MVAGTYFDAVKYSVHQYMEAEVDSTLSTGSLIPLIFSITGIVIIVNCYVDDRITKGKYEHATIGSTRLVVIIPSGCGDAAGYTEKNINNDALTTLI